MAEVELLEEKQILETEARKLKIKEELAKAKARFSVYHNIPVDDRSSTHARVNNKDGKIKRRKCLVQEKRQQTKIYNEDQLWNAWDKFDQRMKEKEGKFYRKTSRSNKKLLGWRAHKDNK